MKWRESQNLEFKESLAQEAEAMVDICAMTNRDGGQVWFGIRNNGKVKGLGTISEKTLRDLSQHIRSGIDPVIHVSINVRELEGVECICIDVEKSDKPLHTYKGVPYIRSGSESQKMSKQEHARRLVQYGRPEDYSSAPLREATWSDLDPRALLELREAMKRARRVEWNIDTLTDRQVLENLRLMRDGVLTNAAVIILGTAGSLARFFPYAEVKYAYFADDGQARGQDLVTFDGGYLLFHDALWRKIDSRNLNIETQNGLMVENRKAFDEETVREAVNNAIAHRDYLVSRSVMIEQRNASIEITSPGGLPEGITVENIRHRTSPRNKLIADVLKACGFVDEFGSGVNLMYQKQLESGKAVPEYRTSQDEVKLRIDGVMHDPNFVLFVTAAAARFGRRLSDEELLLLDGIRRGRRIAAKTIPLDFVRLGLVEHVRYGKYVLSRDYYRSTGSTPEYTLERGMNNLGKKALILEHLALFPEGATKSEILRLFHDGTNPRQVYALLSELRSAGKVSIYGKPTAPNARWKLDQDATKPDKLR